MPSFPATRRPVPPAALAGSKDLAVDRSEPAGATSSTAVVQAENLEKVYAMGDVKVHALRGISLRIEPGEFIAVMGASGSGKSTFMNLVGCLDRPTGGRYLLRGQDVSRFSRDQLARVRGREIGFVFQGFNLLPRTSALENVELPMLYQGIPARERRRKAAEAPERVGLGGRGGPTPAHLPRGQQPRGALARPLVDRPKLPLAAPPAGQPRPA